MWFLIHYVITKIGVIENDCITVKDNTTMNLGISDTKKLVFFSLC